MRPIIQLTISATIAGFAAVLASCRGCDWPKNPPPPPAPPDDDDDPLPPPPPPPPDDELPSPKPTAGNGPYPELPVPLSNVSAFVWKDENRVTSTYEVDGQAESQYVEVRLPFLANDAESCVSPYVKLQGQGAQKGNFRQVPFRKGETVVTRDGFDQSQACFDFHMMIGSLKLAGQRLEELYPKPLTLLVNQCGDLNAWFDPSNDEINLCRGDDKFHTAGDGNILVHESGHKNLHMQADKLISGFGGEGRAIHEGKGDADATLIYRKANPYLSEDFCRHIGRQEGRECGLRNADNDLTLSKAGKEAHDRGRVYAGFMYSIYDDHLRSILDDDQARSLAYRLAQNFGPNFGKGSNVSPQDFVQAYVRGAEGLNRAGQLPTGITIEQLVQMIQKEGKRREMLSKDLPPEEDLQAEDPREVMALITAETRGGTLFTGTPRRIHWVGGLTESYQQYTPLDTNFHARYGDKAAVFNRSVDVRRDTVNVRIDTAGGAVLGLHEDIRRIPLGEISMAWEVTEEEALQIARRRVEKDLKRLEQKPLQGLKVMEQELRQGLRECRSATDFQKRHFLTADGKQQEIKASLVVYGEDRHLSYMFTLPGVTVFVPIHKKNPSPDEIRLQSHVIY